AYVYVGKTQIWPWCVYSSSLNFIAYFKLFEGMKAYRGVDGKIRLFRPSLNMERMARSARRMTLPCFDQNELLECIRKLLEVEKEWVPYSSSASLYIRPTLIGTEPSLGVKKPTKALLYVILSPVGAYFSSECFNPISLWADPKYVRAWKGGTGDCKLGGNYGSSIYAQQEALELGCQQVLWLYGEDHQITEVGTMNLFLYWINEDGENELATPPLDGIILPGVTRQSILDLARNWVSALAMPVVVSSLITSTKREFKVSERYITMSDLTTALEENRVKEMFGAGTACICMLFHFSLSLSLSLHACSPFPLSSIHCQHLHIPTMENGPQLSTRILNKLTDIQ
ncbi:hypothetical protein ASZ78_012910, partial [Callipepla squamata]